MFWIYYALALAAPFAAWALYRYRPWIRRPFVNQTRGVLTDQQIQTLWDAGAYDLATQSFPLAPVVDGANSALHPAEPRAVAVRPRAVTVEVHEDTAEGDGWTDAGHTYPVRGLTRCNWLLPPRITISRRWASAVLPYEAQNLILIMLGYDVRGR